jgi:Ras GTPase-activating-like protein IQGAP2/3
MVRSDFLAWHDHLQQSHLAAVYLQSLFRGLIERRKFRTKMEYYRANLSKVVKIQTLFRAKETREQYWQLTLGKNVNVGTIKNFVHLLDNSEADFEDEIELEQLWKHVVESILENQQLETELNELDVKIALVI